MFKEGQAGNKIRQRRGLLVFSDYVLIFSENHTGLVATETENVRERES
jgi:hypothetical protein